MLDGPGFLNVIVEKRYSRYMLGHSIDEVQERDRAIGFVGNDNASPR